MSPRFVNDYTAAERAALDAELRADALAYDAAALAAAACPWECPSLTAVETLDPREAVRA